MPVYNVLPVFLCFGRRRRRFDDPHVMARKAPKAFAIGTTPAVEAGLTDFTWAKERLLTAASAA